MSARRTATVLVESVPAEHVDELVALLSRQMPVGSVVVLPDETDNARWHEPNPPFDAVDALERAIETDVF